MFLGKQCGKTEEALNFYTSVFHNTKLDHILSHGKGQEPEKEGTIKYDVFTLKGKEFAAMDSARGHNCTFNEAIYLVRRALRYIGRNKLLLGKLLNGFVLIGGRLVRSWDLPVGNILAVQLQDVGAALPDTGPSYAIEHDGVLPARAHADPPSGNASRPGLKVKI
jgi:3-demethylubiquinone-9 3-methyltransferase